MRTSVIKTTLFFVAIAASSIAVAQTPTAGTATDTAESSTAEAKALLLDMATLLGESARFQVDMRVGYDSVQADGQKIEFGEKRRLSVERPSLVLNEVTDSDGNGELILFDGKWITVSDPQANVYTRAPQPGDIDATVKYFLSDLGMRLPLAVMLMRTFPQVLESRMHDIALVEETDILGVSTTHVAGRTKDVDFQVWITNDRQPLPLRIVLTYRTSPGEPQFWANFSDWKLNPSFRRNAFEFNPAPGAQEIPLVAQFKPHTETEPESAATSSSSQGEAP